MATLLVNIADKNSAGKVLNKQQVVFDQSLVSVSEIIEKKVAAEVHLHNRQRTENFCGLVHPVEAERQLNGARRTQPLKLIDAEKQIALAKEAFCSNGFFLLIDNIQAESLEQTFLLHPQSAISFVKLTPLVGG
jgi:hypothetical protein